MSVELKYTDCFTAVVDKVKTLIKTVCCLFAVHKVHNRVQFFFMYIFLFGFKSDCSWANLGAYRPALTRLLRAVRGVLKFLDWDVQ